MATRCCSPPDRRSGRLVPRPPSPTRSSRARARAQPRVGDPAVQLERQQQILLDGQEWDEVEELEHEADVSAPEARARVLVERGEIGAVHEHAARRRAVDTRDQVQERRLPRPAPPDEHGDLTRGDGDRDIAQHGPLGIAFAVGLADPLELDGGPSHAHRLYRAAKRARPSPRRPPPSERRSPQKFLAKRSRLSDALRQPPRGSLRGVPP